MENIIKKLLSLSSAKETVFVAIDGMPGGGKSTLVKHIQAKIPNIKLIRMDDFYSSSQQNIDYGRVKKDILGPLKEGETARFKIYDWNSNIMIGAKPISPSGIILVEGIYSMEKDLIDAYDFKIWVDCPANIGLERGVSRDKGQNEKLWIEKWMPATVAYIEEQKPYKLADVVISYKDIPALRA